MSQYIHGLLPGMGAMANVHPMVVHFPIALLNGFLLMEVLGAFFNRDDMRAAASWMLYLGAIGAAAAVAAGLQAAPTVEHGEEVHAIMTRHMYFGFTVLALAVILSVWRARAGAGFTARARAAHILVAIVTAAVMAFGADLGGLMVYGHGVGTQGKAATADAGHHHGPSAPPHEH